MTAPLFRWIIEQPGGLPELLRAHGLTQALHERRVFVDGQRALDGDGRRLAPGSVVEVYAPRPPAQIEILHQSEGVIAVYKPAELPTEPDRSGSASVLLQLAERLGSSPRELFAVSRLDVGVSGVLLFAASSVARQRMLEERARGRLQRRYIALACGVPVPEAGEWRDALGRGRAGERVVGGAESQQARTHYRLVAVGSPVAPGRPPTSLLVLAPITGRTHQLRVHTSAHGLPLLGDRKYSGPVRTTRADGAVQSLPRVLLHAASVAWGPGPERPLVVSQPPTDLVDVWIALRGDPSALTHALD